MLLGMGGHCRVSGKPCLRMEAESTGTVQTARGGTWESWKVDGEKVGGI